MDLVGDGDNFRSDRPGWYFTVELAQDHGRVPAVTRPPLLRDMPGESLNVAERFRRDRKHAVLHFSAGRRRGPFRVSGGPS